jgi:hypothetical protein
MAGKTASKVAGSCFLREHPETAGGPDQRAGERERNRCSGVAASGVSVREIPGPRRGLAEFSVFIKESDGVPEQVEVFISTEETFSGQHVYQ